MSRVVVLGGGIGGVEAAIHLKEKGFDVTLVSERDYLYIYPISIWVPTGEASFRDITIPLERLSKIHSFEFIHDRVLSISTAEAMVTLEERELSYDHLIIALGGEKVKHEGIEHTFSVCGKPEDSLKLKERLDSLVKRGSGKIAIGFGGNPKDPSGIRGGPAFEVIFNILNFLKKRGVRENFDLSFFAPMEVPGARLGKENARKIFRLFEKETVTMRFGKKITGFRENGVIFEDDSTLTSDLTMFIAATTGHSIFRKSNLPLNEAGFVLINEYCEVKEGKDVADQHMVYAIGDGAAIDGPQWRAKQGHLAEVMAKIAATNLANTEKGLEERESYIPHVNIICLMDMGNGGGFVYRNTRRSIMLPLPVIGHTMKKAWGWYYKNSKLKKIPRIPNL